MYAITHEGKVFSTDGLITDIEGTPLLAADAAAYNKALETQELEHFKSGPERIMAYCVKVDTTNKTFADALSKGWTTETTERKHWQSSEWHVQTWLGTDLGQAFLGDRAYSGFRSYHGASYRRSITVRIFGTLYHGWYFESSGDYCRLKRAKIQTGKYAATV